MQLHLHPYFNSQTPTSSIGLTQKQAFLDRHKSKSSINPLVSKILYPLGAYGVLPFFFQEIKMIGLENIPLHSPVILAPTHRSRWDGLLVTFATGKLTTGRDLHYMVSADEFKGLQGWIIKQMGGFAVDTRCPKISSFRHSIQLLQENKMVVIFPEGGIFRDGKIHDLKNGVARIALQVEQKKIKSNVKIIPMVINYSDQIPKKGSKVEIKIGKGLNVEEYKELTIKKATQNLMRELRVCLEKLDQS